jgi:hypothetical protein
MAYPLVAGSMQAAALAASRIVCYNAVQSSIQQ